MLGAASKMYVMPEVGLFNTPEYVFISHTVTGLLMVLNSWALTAYLLSLWQTGSVMRK